MNYVFEKKSQGKAVELILTDSPFENQLDRSQKEKNIRHIMPSVSHKAHLSSSDLSNLFYLVHYKNPNTIKVVNIKTQNYPENSLP